MAAKLSEGLGEQVTCAICLDHYSDPRLLPCLHTYCTKCLQLLLAQGKNKDAVVCPECREEVKILSGDVTKLKVNFLINNLLSLLAVHSTEAGKDGGKADGKSELTCESCDLQETATRRCTNCCMFMCDFCATSHKRVLATKGHQLMTMDEIKNTGIPVRENQVFCEKHKGEVKKLFCNTCQELICRDCTIIDHRDHEFSFLDEVADEHKKLLKEEVETATSIKDKVEEVLLSVQEMKHKVEERSKISEKNIDGFIDELIKALEEKRNVLKDESRRISASKMKELAAQEDGLVMQLTGLKSAIEFTEKVMTNGGHSDVLSMSKQLTSRLSQLSERSFTEVPCQGDKIGLKSEKDQFEEFIRSAKVVDATNYGEIDYGKCFVARKLDGRLVQDSTINATKGEVLEFVFQIKNSFGENLKLMEERIEVSKLLNEDWPGEVVHVESCPDGTYRFTVVCHGRSAIYVFVDGKHISGSPIQIYRRGIRAKKSRWRERQMNQ